MSEKDHFLFWWSPLIGQETVLPVFSVVAIVSRPINGLYWETSGCFFFVIQHQVSVCVNQILLRHLFPWLGTPSSSSFFSCERLQSLNPSCTEESRIAHSTRDVSHQCWEEGKGHCPWPAGNVLQNTASYTVSLCCKGTPQSASCLPGLWGFSPTSCFPAGFIWVPGVTILQVQDFAIPLVEHHGNPLRSILYPVKIPPNSRSFVVSATSHTFLSSVDLLVVQYGH